MRKYLLPLLFIVSLCCVTFSTASRREIHSNLAHHRNLQEDAPLDTHGETSETGAHGTSETHGTEAAGEEHEETKFTPDQSEFWFCIGMALFLCCFAGAMSGLTVGYLSIDQLQLELKMKNGTDQEKADANIIMPILEKHHLLISTLLLSNAFAMEALPLFLDAIMPAAAAIIVSTSFVVILGEIAPQAYCTGPDQIKIARNMAPMIKGLMFVLYPICYPISLALDHILGVHQKTRFVKKDLKALIELHELNKSGAPRSQNWGHDGGHEIKADAHLTVEEVKVINSTIDLRDTPVTKEMEKIEKIFMIGSSAKIDRDMLKRISRSGYSKIPVYKNRDKNIVIGFVRAKTLLEFEKVEGRTIEDSGVPLTPPLIVASDTSMLEMLMLFQEKKTSIALVSEETVKDKGGNAFLYSTNAPADQNRARLIGLFSLKDIFEEILESKMMDDDVHGAVTLQSAQNDRIKKRFGGGKAPLGEIKEAAERPEKGVSRGGGY